MAEGNYNVPHQERDIRNHLRDYGLSIYGVYSDDTTATEN